MCVTQNGGLLAKRFGRFALLFTGGPEGRLTHVVDFYPFHPPPSRGGDKEYPFSVKVTIFSVLLLTLQPQS